MLSDQPVNAYVPALTPVTTVVVSVVGKVKSDPYCCGGAVGNDDDVAMPRSKVIVGETIVHFAYKIRLVVVVTTPLTATFVPVPAALVFQPSNVYPVFTSGGVEFVAALNVVPVVKVAWLGAVPEVAPFAL